MHCCNILIEKGCTYVQARSWGPQLKHVHMYPKACIHDCTPKNPPRHEALFVLPVALPAKGIHVVVSNMIKQEQS